MTSPVSSRPPGPRLHVVHLDQCDRRKCTAIKLQRFGLVRVHKSFRTVPLLAVKLNPYAAQVLSVDDRPLVEKHGLVVIDCSWNKAGDVFPGLRLKNDRRLSVTFLAANPVNYAMPGKLSSVEALAASLFITGYPDEATFLLSKFTWGHTFLELNAATIDGLAGAGLDGEEGKNGD